MKLTRGRPVGDPGLTLRNLQVVDVENPLERYPDRGWERVYRQQYAYESSFTFVCSPNDTHACRLRCMVRNGVARIEQNYDVHRYADPFGNTAGASWNARARSLRTRGRERARVRTVGAKGVKTNRDRADPTRARPGSFLVNGGRVKCVNADGLGTPTSKRTWPPTRRCAPS